MSTGTFRIQLIDSNSGGGYAQGQAFLADTIHVLGPLPSATTVTLTFTTNGSLADPLQASCAIDPNCNNARIQSVLSASVSGLSSVAETTFFVSDDCTGFAIPGVSTCQSGVGSFTDLITLSFLIDDQHRDISIGAGLEAGDARFNGQVLFPNGVLGLLLPDGLTFTSDSGFLLTAPTNGAPEPATLALLGIGLAALVLRRRKH